MGAASGGSLEGGGKLTCGSGLACFPGNTGEGCREMPRCPCSKTQTGAVGREARNFDNHTTSWYTASANEGEDQLGFTAWPRPSSSPTRNSDWGTNLGIVLIKSVDLDSWSERNSVAIGDELVAINGRGIAEMEKRELKALMQCRPLQLEFAHLQPVVSPAVAGHVRQCDLQGFKARFQYSGNRLNLYVGDEVEQLGFIPTSYPPLPVCADSIEDGSWADVNGLTAGDRLMEVHGARVDAMTKRELKEVMRLRPQRVTFCRGHALEYQAPGNEFEREECLPKNWLRQSSPDADQASDYPSASQAPKKHRLTMF